MPKSRKELLEGEGEEAPEPQESEETTERREPPRVKAQNLGSMNTTVESPVDALREKYPNKDFRYVYAPEHDSKYAQLAKRKMQGYEPVPREAAEDAEIALPPSVAGDHIRVGDVVLMWIDKDKREVRQEELDERAQADAKRAQRVFEQNVRGNTKEGVGATPVGSVTRQERTHRLGTGEE